MKKVTRDTLKKRWFTSSAAKVALIVVPVAGSLFLVYWMIVVLPRTPPVASRITTLSWVAYVGLFFGPLGQMIALFSNWWWYLRPFKDRVRKHDWRLCPKCAYPFQGSGDVTCTECGEKFVGDEVRNAWRGWIKPVGWWKRWRPDT